MPSCAISQDVFTLCLLRRTIPLVRESTFLERYGSWIALGLVTLFAWRMIAADLHESMEFGLLFPYWWIEFSPAGPFVQSLVAPYQHAEWWILVDTAITVLIWMMIYYLIRGVFYYVTTMEGPSMWVTFAFCIGLAIAGFAFLLWPAFDQINTWWAAWPGAQQPLY